MNQSINSETRDFVGITNRQIKTYESRHELSIWIVKGCVKVGDNCKIYTESGLVEAQIISIRTVDGFVLEAHADTQTLITFSGLPINVMIPWKSVVSTKGYTMEEYASLPFEMIISDTYDHSCRILVIVGHIYQGTIRIDDRILISNEEFTY